MAQRTIDSMVDSICGQYLKAFQALVPQTVQLVCPFPLSCYVVDCALCRMMV